MNITFVSDAIYPYNKGGKEKRLYELSTRLAAMGHDVHIYTMHWWKGSETFRYENGVTLHAICKYHDMYSGDRRSIIQALIFGISCFKLILAKFDVLDVDHMPYFPIYSTWLVCKLKHKKLYATWHEVLKRSEWVDYMGTSGNVAFLIERISIHLPYVVTVSSNHTKLLIGSELKRTKKVDVVACGIDTKLIDKIVPAKIICDVLYVGRLVKDKNIDMLIRAIRIMSESKPDIKCIIIGNGTEKSYLTKLINELNLNKNVQMLESLSNASDVYAYMKAATVFCLPSSREGFGIVVLEALACGTPVVTINTLTNAAQYLIHENKNGSIVVPTTDMLSRALNLWITNSSNINSINLIDQFLDWDVLAEKQFGIYLQ